MFKCDCGIGSDTRGSAWRVLDTIIIVFPSWAQEANKSRIASAFSTDELMARIRALGCRSEAQFIGGELSIETITIYPQKLEVIIDENVIVLSVKEILDRVWGLDSETDVSK